MTATSATKRPATTPWLGVVVLALGIFTMTTMEELPIGVLTLVAGDLSTSHGTVGLGVTVPGVLAAVIAVVAPAVIGSIDRRFLLSGALFCVTVSGFISAVAHSPGVFIASRILVGVGLGVFWSLLGATVARIAAPGQQSKALTVAFSGISGAIVIGVPLATWLGEQLGWQNAFIAVAVAAAAVAVSVVLFVPKAQASAVTSSTDIVMAAKRRGVQFGFLYTFILVTAHFTAYTYASPVLQELVGIPVTGISGMLFSFGIAGLCGNFLVGPLMKRSVTAALTVIPAGILAALVLFVMGAPVPAAAIMVVWGLFGGAISVVSQAWILRSAGDVAEAASGLNSGAFNIAIALGALIGGGVDGGALSFLSLPALAGGTRAVVIIACFGIIGATVLGFLAIVFERHLVHKRASRRNPSAGDFAHTSGSGG